MEKIKDRAKTDKERWDLLLRLYVVWINVPELRLGQLISNCTDGRDVFHVEDKNLIEEIESKIFEMKGVNVTR